MVLLSDDTGPQEPGQDPDLTRLPSLLRHLPALHQELGQEIQQRNWNKLCKSKKAERNS